MAKIPYASVVGILMWNMLCTWPNIDKYKNAKKYSMFSFLESWDLKRGSDPSTLELQENIEKKEIKNKEDRKKRIKAYENTSPLGLKPFELHVKELPIEDPTILFLQMFYSKQRGDKLHTFLH